MRKKIFYGFGGLSYSVISQTITNFFMFFATSVIGLSGTLVGVAIAISTIWDGISDTLIGYFSDYYPIKGFGRRNGYMLIATIGMSVFNIVLWCIPISISPVIKFIWITVTLLILETFNTMFSTPHSALCNELVDDYHDRTKLGAYSTIFYLIGIIIPSILLVVFLPNTTEYPIGQLNPMGYKYIAITTSAICLCFGLICALFTINKTNINKNKEKNINNSVREKTKLFSNFFSAFKDKRLKKIILGYVLTSISTVFLCSVGLHFFTYSFFYTSRQITILLLTLILGTIASQPLWVKISNFKRKKPALIIGILMTVLAVFGVILIYLFRIDLYKISFYLMVFAILICGLGSGALYNLPTSMYRDVVGDICKDGDNLNATYSGVLTFASNMANSITQLIVGVLLDLVHFDSSLEVQTLSVQTALALILFIGVEVTLILAFLIFNGVKENKNYDKISKT